MLGGGGDGPAWTQASSLGSPASKGTPAATPLMHAMDMSNAFYVYLQALSDEHERQLQEVRQELAIEVAPATISRQHSPDETSSQHVQQQAQPPPQLQSAGGSSSTVVQTLVRKSSRRGPLRRSWRESHKDRQPKVMSRSQSLHSVSETGDVAIEAKPSSVPSTREVKDNDRWLNSEDHRALEPPVQVENSLLGDREMSPASEHQVDDAHRTHFEDGRGALEKKNSQLPFVLMEGWQNEPHHFKWKRWNHMSTSHQLPNTGSLEFSMVAAAPTYEDTGPLKFFILHPGSVKRMCWDVASMLLLAYDLVTIPFMSAFKPEEPAALRYLLWFTMGFWTFDIAMSFISGYETGQHVVLVPLKIAKRYLRFWFWLDILILSVDWGFVLAQSGTSSGGSEAARLGRSLRALRFLRTFRFLRIAKLKRIVHEIQDRISTERISIWFGICKAITSLLFVNHLVACCWYGIGQLKTCPLQGAVETSNNLAGSCSNDCGIGWVHSLEMEEHPLTYRYATALHWSLAQFTPAPNEVFPQNLCERVFAVAVIVTALVFFSAFVSTVTAGVVQLRQLGMAKSNDFWKLRRFLRDWKVREHFRRRVIRYLEYAYQQQRQRVQEHDVKLLGLLSDHLRNELRQEVFQATLSGHPLFHTTMMQERSRIFGSVLQSEALAQGDLAFDCGEQGVKMIFLISGILEYFMGELEDGPSTEAETWLHNGGAPPMPAGVANSIPQSTSSTSRLSAPARNEYLKAEGENHWVCEPVLWTSTWLHLGDLQAYVDCSILTVDADRFCNAIQHNQLLWKGIRSYAAEFVIQLNTIPREALTDLTHKLVTPENCLRTDIGVCSLDLEDQQQAAEHFMVACFKALIAPFSRRGSTSS